MIGSSKIEMNKFGARVVKLAKINLGASQTIEGKKRVTNNTGALSNSLGYRLKQKRTSTGQFSSGFDIEFTSSLDYAPFIEYGVRGSESSPIGARNSPFKFKAKNLPKGVVAGWMQNKPMVKRFKTLRLKDAGTGKFIKDTPQARRQAEFLIGRKIATTGIAPRNYYSDAIEQAVQTNGGDVAVSMALDFIKNNIKKLNK